MAWCGAAQRLGEEKVKQRATLSARATARRAAQCAQARCRRLISGFRLSTTTPLPSPFFFSSFSFIAARVAGPHRMWRTPVRVAVVVVDTRGGWRFTLAVFLLFLLLLRWWFASPDGLWRSVRLAAPPLSRVFVGLDRTQDVVRFLPFRCLHVFVCVCVCVCLCLRLRVRVCVLFAFGASCLSRGSSCRPHRCRHPVMADSLFFVFPWRDARLDVEGEDK